MNDCMQLTSDLFKVSVTVVSSTKLCVIQAGRTASINMSAHPKQIKMLFGVSTSGRPWNIVLDVGPDPPRERKRGPSSKF